MANEKLRRRIAWDAAQLIRAGQESEYQAARMKAARRAARGWIPDEDLPSDEEIRSLVHTAAPPAGVVLGDRFDFYKRLLLPLEQVKLNPEYHPEGDCLHHTLQVFDLARHELPYDEEFLLAALLHDVGKAIDRKNHIAAGLSALDGYITPRTAWLIEHHTEANQMARGELGVRAKRRLETHEDFHELELLSKCDRGGRQKNMLVPDVDDALKYLRELEQEHGE
ncbi:MAG TPA: HD domain-containing protein [Pirellulales bacterium]|nr:HD domain-containing protein [Pirellulales bacterium]